MKRTYVLLFPLLAIVAVVFLNSLWYAIHLKRELEGVTRTQFVSLSGALRLALEGAYLADYLMLDNVRKRLREETLLLEKILTDKKDISKLIEKTRIKNLWIIERDGDTLPFPRDEDIPPWIKERIYLLEDVKEVFLHPEPISNLYAYLKRRENGEILILLSEERGREALGYIFRFQRLLDILTASGDLIYLAVIDNSGNVLSWSSQFEDYLPINVEGKNLDKNLRILKSPIGRILEMRVPFLEKGGESLTLVAGYAYFPVDDLTANAFRNTILVGLLFVVIGVIGIISAHYLRKKIEEKEKLLEESKRREEYFRELSALSSGVAHEIKNPLNTIQMALQRLRTKGASEGDVERYYKLTQKEIKRLNDIVDNFLKLGKPISPVFRKFNFRYLAEDLMLFFLPEAEKRGVEIKIELPEELMINADPDLMRQVLMNLIKNSLDATEKGYIKLSFKEQNRKKCIIVEDTGCGMTEEQILKAFQPYFTTKTKGVGLGLAIARRIVEAHGGKIWIDSEKGKGTRVFIELPEALYEASSSNN
jgi:signal transduction histidine kinase